MNTSQPTFEAAPSPAEIVRDYFHENRFRSLGDIGNQDALNDFFAKKNLTAEIKPLVEKELIQALKNDVCTQVKPSEICAAMLGKRVRFRAQVVGLKRANIRPIEAEYQCLMCDYHAHIIFPADPRKHPTLPEVCPECKRRSLRMDEAASKFVDVIELLVREPVADSENSVQLRRPIRIYADQNIPKEFSGLVDVSAIVWSDLQKKKGTPSKQKLAIFAQDIECASDFYTEYTPTEDDGKAFAKYFNADSFSHLKEQSDGTIAPYIRGRGLAKAGADVCAHSALCDGKQNTQTTILFPGDSRTGKSDLLEDMSCSLCPAGSEYVPCESASRTGLAYSIDTSGDEAQLEFGCLVSADGMLVALDAINALGQEEQSQLREVISKKRVKVMRMLKGEANARVRIIGATNLPKDKPLSYYATRYQAALNALFSKVDRNRYDFVILFGEHDVPHDTISEAEKFKTKEKGEPSRTIPAEIYRKHLAYCWQVHPIQMNDDVLDFLIDSVKKIRKEQLNGTEIVSNEFEKVSIRWTIAFAQRCHSFDEKGICIVEKKHVLMYLEFVNEWLADLEIDKEIQLQNQTRNVDIPALAEQLNEYTNKRAFILLLATNSPTQQKDIARKLGQKPNYVSGLAKELRDLDLVRPATEGRGLELSESGVKVARAMAGMEPKSMQGGE